MVAADTSRQPLLSGGVTNRLISRLISKIYGENWNFGVLLRLRINDNLNVSIYSGHFLERFQNHQWHLIFRDSAA
jgi:hypothetical protein